MAHRSSRVPVVAIVLILALTSPASAQVAAPAGQITLAATVTLAPTWFDPAETPGVITPFLTLYALHDALVKPMPGNAWAPCLAESWTMSKDGLTYEFVLRKNVRFHNGDPLTADDVKFSFERYKGGGATTLRARVAAVEVVDPQRIRFRMKQPWPDFMTFYATPATSAAWIVPKKHMERVGLAVILGIDRKTFSDAEELGHGRPAPSIIPRDVEFYWTPSAYPYDPV